MIEICKASLVPIIMPGSSASSSKYIEALVVNGEIGVLSMITSGGIPKLASSRYS